MNAEFQRRARSILAIALTAGACVLHVVLFLHAGALWRDEANTLAMVAQPSIGEMWSTLENDSFPLLWLLILRGWTHFPGLRADAALRGLGLAVGLGLLAMVWFNARRFRLSAPVWGLVLFALAPAVIRFGDSLRAYGIGMCLGLFALGAIRAYADRPGRWRLVVATVASLLCVQALYYNSLVVFAACCGGFAVAWLRRSPRLAAGLLALGGISAASLLPYLLVTRRMTGWVALVRIRYDAEWFRIKLAETLSLGGGWMPAVWAVLWVLAVAVAFMRVRRSEDPAERELSAFCGTVLLAGPLTYFWFLKILSYATSPWYYLGLMMIVAAVIDPPLQSLPGRWPALLSLVAAAALACSVALPAYRVVRLRFTNLDVIAARVSREARPGDLVVVSPWFAGITFNRYYHGAARFETLPPLPTHAWHRYDVVARLLGRRDAIDPLIDATRATLASGQRVFYVVDHQVPDTSEFPPGTRVVRSSEVGWGAVFADSLAGYGRRVQPVWCPCSGVDSYERLMLDIREPRGDGAAAAR